MNMESERIKEFLLNSPLKELLSDPLISDISYDGQRIFYFHRQWGRQRSDIIMSTSEAKDFLRQIANLTNQPFCVSNPIMDTSILPFRINGVFDSIGERNERATVTFSIRRTYSGIISFEEGINNKIVFALLKTLLRLNQSMVIAGQTGSGKTELQKYLLSKLPSDTRVIVIDTVDELMSPVLDHLDLTFWRMNPSFGILSIDDLIRNGLRNHPDWLIIAESRGQEMHSIINAALSGHPTLVTLHSGTINDVYTRIGRMAIIGPNDVYQEIINDAHTAFPIVIQMQKKILSSSIERYIETIGISVDRQLHVIYFFDGKQEKFMALPERVRTMFATIDAEAFSQWEHYV